MHFKTLEVNNMDSNNTSSGVITTESCKLNGTISLIYEKKFYSRKNGKSQLLKVETTNFPFQIVSEKELMKRRIEGKPIFVLYKKGFRFYTEIPKLSFSALHSIAKTKCTKNTDCCERLLPMPTDIGGCDKVFDLNLDRYSSDEYTLQELLVLAKRIDKYPFITAGFETYNTTYPLFVVMECRNCTLK